jgi:hypothetical protein
MPDTLVAHGGLGAVGVGRRVVAVGGERLGSGLTGTIAATEVFNPKRDRWKRLPDLLNARHGLGVAADRKRVYAIEGGTITFIGVSNFVEMLRL